MATIDLDHLRASLETALAAETDAADGSHDLGHVRRVWSNCGAIARATTPRPDLPVLLAAAYLHDVANVPKNAPERARASTLAAARAVEILTALGFPADRLPAVRHAIEAHSFSAGIAPTTIEAEILQDADRLSNRPRVISRVPWQVEQNPDGSLTFSAPNKGDATTNLADFYDEARIDDDSGRITLTVNVNDIDALANVFNNDNVKETVKDRVSPNLDDHLQAAKGEAQVKQAEAQVMRSIDLLEELAPDSEWEVEVIDDVLRFSGSDVDTDVLDSLDIGYAADDDGVHFEIDQGDLGNLVAWLENQQSARENAPDDRQAVYL